jgi:hypothetical protein
MERITEMTSKLEPSVDENSSVEQWLQARKEEATRIDPDTAEVFWTYERTLDPYGLDPDLSEELQQIGREWFARTPGSDIWVWFGDLPIETRKRLERKHESTEVYDPHLVF